MNSCAYNGVSNNLQNFQNNFVILLMLLLPRTKNIPNRNTNNISKINQNFNSDASCGVSRVNQFQGQLSSMLNQLS